MLLLSSSLETEVLQQSILLFCQQNLLQTTTQGIINPGVCRARGPIWRIGSMFQPPSFRRDKTRVYRSASDIGPPNTISWIIPSRLIKNDAGNDRTR